MTGFFHHSAIILAKGIIIFLFKRYSNGQLFSMTMLSFQGKQSLYFFLEKSLMTGFFHHSAIILAKGIIIFLLEKYFNGRLFSITMLVFLIRTSCPFRILNYLACENYLWKLELWNKFEVVRQISSWLLSIDKKNHQNGPSLCSCSFEAFIKIFLALSGY